MSGVSSTGKNSSSKKASAARLRVKKYPAQERSVLSDALDSISEGGSSSGDGSAGQTNLDDDAQEGLGEDLGEENMEEEAEPTLREVMNYLHSFGNRLQKQIARVSDRVTKLEVPRNLAASGGFDTPPEERKQKKAKSTKTPSMLQSVAYSAMKQDWRTMGSVRAVRESGAGDGDSNPSSSDSEVDTEGVDNSSNMSKGVYPDGSSDGEQEDNSSSGRDNSRRNPDGRDNSRRNPSGQLFKTLRASEKRAAQTVVSVTRVEKECKVRITEFTLSKVAKAMRNIMEFQEQECTQVRMTKVLSQSCKEHLRVKYNIQSVDLQDMGSDTLFAIIARETQVHSSIEFYKQLKEAMGHAQLMDWSTVNPGNHETYYFQQLKLVDEFMRLLKLMLHENRKWCPRINEKENGLIRLFKSFHSYSYWSYTWSSMSQRYSNMQEFMDEYTDKAMQQYSLSQAIKEMPYMSRGSGDKSTEKERQYHDSKRDIGKSLSRGNYSNSGYSRSASVSHIQDAESEDSTEEDSTWKNAKAESTIPKSTEDSDDSISVASYEERQVEESDTGEQEEADERMLDITLAAFADHATPKADRSNYPCLRKMLSGKCESVDCPYGHRYDTLKKGAVDMQEKLAAFISSQGSGTTSSRPKSYQVLSKDKYQKH